MGILSYTMKSGFLLNNQDSMESKAVFFHGSNSENQWWGVSLTVLGCPVGSAGKRLGSLGFNPNISHLQVGEITHFLTIDPYFLGLPSGDLGSFFCLRGKSRVNESTH